MESSLQPSSGWKAVVIGEGDDRRARGTPRSVSPRCLSSVRFASDGPKLEPGTRHKVLEDRRGVVWRTIVDDDDLELAWAERLGF